MASTRVLRMGFAGGELSPRMFGRVDDVKYQSGAARLRNFVVEPQGAIENRAGLKFVATTKNTNNVDGTAYESVARLIPFKFSIDQTMVLEFGANGGGAAQGASGYIRFHTAGAPLLITAPDVSDPLVFAVDFQAQANVTFTVASPGVVNWAAHVLKNGEPVVFTIGAGPGVLPNELLAGAVYYVRNRAAGVFNLSATPTGPLIDFTGAPAAIIVGKRRYSLADLVRFGGEYFYCMTGNDSQSPPNVAFWYEQADDIYEVPTLYTSAQLFGIRYDQSFDVLTLVHTEQFPRELRRLGATRWTWVPVALGANLPAPSNPSVVDFNGERLDLQSVTNASPRLFTVPRWHGFVANDTVFVTGLVTDTSLNDQFFTVSETNLSAAGVVPGTFELKRYSGGQIVNGGTNVPTPEGTIALSQPTVEIRNRYRITAIDANQNESDPSAVVTANNNLFVIGAFNAVCWDSVVGAVRYAVFKERDGLYGFIGQTEQDNRPLSATVSMDGATEIITWAGHQLVTGEAIRFDDDTAGHALPGGGEIVEGTTYFVRVIDANTFYVTATPNNEAVVRPFSPAGPFTARATRRYKFTDDAIAPDLGTTPPIRDTADLNSANNYPGAVAHFEQRRCFAGTLTDPQTFWATRSNTESDLAYSLPSRDDDRLKFKVASREQQIIRHIVPVGELLLLTDAGEWRVSAVNSEALTPDSISARTQSYIGANGVRPVVTNYSMLFASARGGHLREMAFSFNVNQYVTGDLSLRAAHLFDELDIVDMSYGKAPHPLVYAVSSNGVMLVLTYVPEEQVGAWTWWDTDGAFESVCVVSEGVEDVPYAIVRRTIGGVTRRFVERQSTRDFDALVDATFLDAFRTYSGAPALVISGLGHLEGKTVSILADGVVHPTRVVTAGAITLQAPASKVHVGLAYVADLQTLPVTLQVEAFSVGRTKNVSQVQIRVVASTGILVGPDANQLVPLDPYANAAVLRTEPVDVRVLPDWTKDGQVLVRQSDPLPVTIVGMSIEVAVGG